MRSWIAIPYHLFSPGMPGLFLCAFQRLDSALVVADMGAATGTDELDIDRIKGFDRFETKITQRVMQ